MPAGDLHCTKFKPAILYIKKIKRHPNTGKFISSFRYIRCGTGMRYPTTGSAGCCARHHPPYAASTLTAAYTLIAAVLGGCW
jgi:hypothetical protein